MFHEDDDACVVGFKLTFIIVIVVAVLSVEDGPFSSKDRWSTAGQIVRASVHPCGACQFCNDLPWDDSCCCDNVT